MKFCQDYQHKQDYVEIKEHEEWKANKRKQDVNGFLTCYVEVPSTMCRLQPIKAYLIKTMIPYRSFAHLVEKTSPLSFVRLLQAAICYGIVGSHPGAA